MKKPILRGNTPPHFIAKVERPSEGRRPGFVIAVGKRVFSKAVDRNLLKRRARAALRELEKNHLGEKFRIKITALPAAKTANYEEIKTDLEKTISRILK